MGKVASIFAVIALGLVSFAASADADTVTLGNPLMAPIEETGMP